MMSKSQQTRVGGDASKAQAGDKHVLGWAFLKLQSSGDLCQPKTAVILKFQICI